MESLVALKRGEPASVKDVSPDFFLRDKNKKVSHLKIDGFIYERRPLGPEEGATQLKVKPLRPVKDLIKEALQAQPPPETGDFLPSDLVELRNSIRLSNSTSVTRPATTYSAQSSILSHAHFCNERLLKRSFASIAN